LSLRALLFGEAQGRVVVSTPDPAAVQQFALRHGVPFHRIGTVGAPGGDVVFTVGPSSWRTPIGRLTTAYHDAIPRLMSKVAISTDEAVLVLSGDV
jgi:phosphoribosylformylglycinamidine synthase subunit PurL